MALPPQHKKRLLQGIAAYIVVVACLGLWIYLKADHTRKDWESRLPQATADVMAAAPVDTAAPAPAADGSTPIIAIIMTNAGVSAKNTEHALEDLPAPVAMAFSPYAAGGKGFLKKAQDGKRETLILIPMEPAAYPKEDPGPKALLTRLSAEENAKALNWILAQGPGVIGAINFMGSRFMSDERNLQPVFSALHAKNLFFVEDSEVPGLPSAHAAQTASMPYLAADIDVDVNPSESQIRQQLIELEKRATERGFAVGIVHPYPVTIGAIKSWAESLDNRGIRLVPLSDIMKTADKHEQKQPDGQPDTP